MPARLDYLEGVWAQPSRLAAALPGLREQLGELSLAELRDGPVALVGMGASLHAAVTAAHDLRPRGVRAHPMSATELCDGAFFDAARRYIVISASGRSRETVDAMARMRPGARWAVTAHEPSPMDLTADMVITTRTGDDSGPCTVSYTGTLQVLGLVAAALGGPGPSGADWAALPDALAGVLRHAEGPVGECAQRFEPMTAIDVVGRGGALGTAGEAALLIREKARVPASAHDTLNYLHGPMEALHTGLGVIVLGDEREARLALDIASYGFQTVLVTRRNDIEAGDRLLVIGMPPDAGGLAGAVMDVAVLQLFAGFLARRLGRGDGKFLYPQEGTKL